MSARSDHQSPSRIPAVALRRGFNSNIDVIDFVLQNHQNILIVSPLRYTSSHGGTASFRMYTKRQGVVMKFLDQDTAAWMLSSELLGLVN
jgi:hypothetical protein